MIEEGLKAYMQDNCLAWEMDKDGGYRHKAPRRAAPKNAQAMLLQELAGQPVKQG